MSQNPTNKDGINHGFMLKINAVTWLPPLTIHFNDFCPKYT